MLTIVRKSRFKKDFKKLQSSGKDLQKLAEVIRMLASEEELPERNRDHVLIGDYADHRECHITPDWLLIYQTTEAENFLGTGYKILIDRRSKVFSIRIS